MFQIFGMSSNEKEPKNGEEAKDVYAAIYGKKDKRCKPYVHLLAKDKMLGGSGEHEFYTTEVKESIELRGYGIFENDRYLVILCHEWGSAVESVFDGMVSMVKTNGKDLHTHNQLPSKKRRRHKG